MEKERKNISSMPLTYIEGLSEELCRVFKSNRCISISYFKCNNTWRKFVCVLNDPTKKEEVSGIVYRLHFEGGKGLRRM